jgi:gliding motility-associated-like protein
VKKWFSIVLLFLSLNSLATHIVGGEMIYDHLGNNVYRITVKVYRDCKSGTAPFDGTGSNGGPTVAAAILTVLTGNGGSLIGTYDIGDPVVTNIPPTINSPCIQTPNNICVQEGIYTYTLMLPSIAGGYYLVYQRCCRNDNVLNLLQSGTQGSTYYAKIPGPEEAAVNSSPRFNKFPPIFLCNDLNFSFDHAATDPDGDRLVYSLCPPFLGMDACCAAIGQTSPGSGGPGCTNPPTTCPTAGSAPPYSTVNFVSPYDGSYPIASNPSVTIDPNTGLLKGHPNLIGQFVVGVCVQEFRGDQLIGTHFRDFQFNIVPCIVSVISAVADQLKQCMGNTMNFINQSSSNVGPLTYHWDFGVPSLADDTSNAVNPSYIYQDTGVYVMTLIANPGKVCSDTLKKKIYVYPPLSVGYKRPENQCLKFNSFSFATKGSFVPQVSFLWNFTANATPSTSTSKDPTGIVYNQAGLYFVKLSAKQFACRDSFIDSIRVMGRPTAVIKSLPASLCDPATVTFSNGSTSDMPMNYYWTFSNGLTTSAYQPTVVLSPAGIYKATLMVITQGVCNDTSITSVNNVIVRAKPQAGFICTPEETSIFEPQVDVINKSSTDVYSWEYDFGDGTFASSPSVTHFYQDYGSYLVTQVVTTQFGCTDRSDHVVKILPEYRFWIPNTFSPDNNGLNDVFKPMILGVENYKFEIYDRWGERLFVSSEINTGWDGTRKGQPCKQDVYIWRATFKNITDLKDESHCGHVLILRNE